MVYRGCDLILSCHEAETDHQKWLATRGVRRVEIMDRVKSMALAALMMAALASVGFYQSPAPEPIRQVVTVEAGDTIYDIARRAAASTGKPERIDVNYLAWKIQTDNHIKDPGSIQPGTVLTINTEG